MTRNPAIASLLAQLDEAFDRRSWHGPNLRGSLRGMGAAKASWRPAPERHNAWEIAVHAAYWKYAAWRRLTGEKRGSFGARRQQLVREPGGADRGGVAQGRWRCSASATGSCAPRWPGWRTATSIDAPRGARRPSAGSCAASPRTTSTTPARSSC